MNAILNKVIENRNGHYVHALEVSDVYELQNVCDTIYSEFIEDFDVNVIIDFFNTMEIYSLDESNENEIYSFDFEEYINTL